MKERKRLERAKLIVKIWTALMKQDLILKRVESNFHIGTKRRNDRIKVKIFAFKMQRVFKQEMELKAKTREERTLNVIRYTINSEVASISESLYLRAKTIVKLFMTEVVGV